MDIKSTVACLECLKREAEALMNKTYSAGQELEQLLQAFDELGLLMDEKVNMLSVDDLQLYIHKMDNTQKTLETLYEKLEKIGFDKIGCDIPGLIV